MKKTFKRQCKTLKSKSKKKSKKTMKGGARGPRSPRGYTQNTRYTTNYTHRARPQKSKYTLKYVPKYTDPPKPSDSILSLYKNFNKSSTPFRYLPLKLKQAYPNAHRYSQANPF
jgi:hypothetical protein